MGHANGFLKPAAALFVNQRATPTSRPAENPSPSAREGCSARARAPQPRGAKEQGCCMFSYGFFHPNPSAPNSGQPQDKTSSCIAAISYVFHVYRRYQPPAWLNPVYRTSSTATALPRTRHFLPKLHPCAALRGVTNCHLISEEHPKTPHPPAVTCIPREHSWGCLQGACPNL